MARTFAHTALHPLLYFETRCKDDRRLDKSVEIYTHNSEKIMLIQKVRGGGVACVTFIWSHSENRNRLENQYWSPDPLEKQKHRNFLIVTQGRAYCIKNVIITFYV